MQPIVHLLNVAGSSSQCARCTAMSKRTKEQCGRPALKASKTQKCQFHGGRGHRQSDWFTVSQPSQEILGSLVKGLTVDAG